MEGIEKIAFNAPRGQTYLHQLYRSKSALNKSAPEAMERSMPPVSIGLSYALKTISAQKTSRQSDAMIHPEYFIRMDGSRRVGWIIFCSLFPGAESAQILHQYLGRKKKEKISSGQPIYQQRVIPKFLSGS